MRLFIPVCNFQSMKSAVDLHFIEILLLCYLVSLETKLEGLQTRPIFEILSLL